MITIKDVMETIDYRITEGSDFWWDCFGPNAYRLDSWNGDQEGYTISMTFDTQDQTVYQVEAHDYRNNRSYRLTHPDFVQAQKDEAVKKNVDNDEAWDDVKFIDLESEEDWLEKARAIVLGEDYDTRVSIPLDIPEDDLMLLFKAAHERDMTFNQFVEEALKAAIEEAKADPEGFKQRAERWKNEKGIL